MNLNNQNLKYSIYKVTNLLNNKIYIGITKRKVRERFNEHCRKSFIKSLLTQNILKYGRDNFKVEVIEICEDLDTLYKKETEYIRSLNAMVPNGYNKCDDIYIYNIENKKHIRPSDETLKKARLARLGSKHTEECKKRMSENRKGIIAYTKPVIAIDSNNNKFYFNSVNEAAKQLNIKPRSISNVLHGWNKRAKKYFFVFQGV